eukprot:5165831-Amphidinium_carterae.1
MAVLFELSLVQSMGLLKDHGSHLICACLLLVLETLREKTRLSDDLPPLRWNSFGGSLLLTVLDARATPSLLGVAHGSACRDGRKNLMLPSDIEECFEVTVR